MVATLMERHVFKDTGIEWIGEIPENWIIRETGNFYRERVEKVSAIDYQPLSVTKKGIVPQLETAAKSDDFDNRKLVRKNDFAINSRSDRRGSCGISKYDGSVSLINTILEPLNTTEMSNKYFEYVFHTDEFADEFYKWGHGIVDDLWTTKWQEMKKIVLPCPPLSEQTKIANYLDSKTSEIKSLINSLNKQIESLKEYKKSLIYKCVTKGLDDSVHLKDSGIDWIGKIPENWIIEKVKFHAQYKSIKNAGTDLKFVALENVESFTSKFIETDNKYDTTESNIADKGDVMFGKLRPYLAKVYLCDEKICAGPGFAVFEPIDVESRYLKYYFINREFINYVNSFCHGTKMPAIDTDVLKNSPLVLPPFSEQVLIADYLDQKCKNIDDIILLEQQTIDKLNEYQKSLIYEYVTGKKEVV